MSSRPPKIPAARAGTRKKSHRDHSASTNDDTYLTAVSPHIAEEVWSSIRKCYSQKKNFCLPAYYLFPATYEHPRIHALISNRLTLPNDKEQNIQRFRFWLGCFFPQAKKDPEATESDDSGEEKDNNSWQMSFPPHVQNGPDQQMFNFTEKQNQIVTDVSKLMVDHFQKDQKADIEAACTTFPTVFLYAFTNKFAMGPKGNHDSGKIVSAMVMESLDSPSQPYCSVIFWLATTSKLSFSSAWFGTSLKEKMETLNGVETPHLRSPSMPNISLQQQGLARLLVDTLVIFTHQRRGKSQIYLQSPNTPGTMSIYEEKMKFMKMGGRQYIDKYMLEEYIEKKKIPWYDEGENITTFRRVVHKMQDHIDSIHVSMSQNFEQISNFTHRHSEIVNHLPWYNMRFHRTPDFDSKQKRQHYVLAHSARLRWDEVEKHVKGYEAWMGTQCIETFSAHLMMDRNAEFHNHVAIMKCDSTTLPNTAALIRGRNVMKMDNGKVVI